MKKSTLILTTLLMCIQFNYAQEPAKKIEVLSTSEFHLNQLISNGIDLRCGAHFNEHGIELELSSSDIEAIDQLGIPYRVIIEDLTKFYKERNVLDLPYAIAQLEIDKARSSMQRNSFTQAELDNYLQYAGCSEIDWATPQNYNLGTMGGCLTIQEAYNEMDDMRTLYPNLISARMDASPTAQRTWGNTLGTAGNQWSGQTVYYVRITGNQSSPEGSKPQTLYTSMIHSREVSSLMSNMFFMWYLLENYDTNPAIKNLVDNNELYFIPVVNPDGLRWNQRIAPSGGGMQRKNLRPNPGDSGSTTSGNSNRGVDLNRNFDYFWGSAGTGSSGSTTSDAYRGPSRASEPETQIIVDFVSARNFKTALWHHSFANGIPHPYGGNPAFVSGREDEMHKWHEDMTKYNRYVSGATIFTPANGIADDWMLGGNPDANGSVGSGQNILATTPEHGHPTETAGNGFWPLPSNITNIAKRAMRMNLMNAYYGGSYATFHDLTQSDINSLSTNLTFGIERIGQTPSNFTLTVTPISNNIVSITSPAIQSGMSILEQRNVTAQIELDPNTPPNAKIEFKVSLENDNHVFYETNMVKYYQPELLLSDNPDVNLLTNWTVAGDWITTTADAYTGSRSIRSTTSAPYSNGANRTLTTASTYNLSNADKILLQFYSKWDIERNYDFATIQGSINGTTWVTLCGRYTKPNSVTTTNDAHGQKNNATSRNFQNNNSGGQVYDGDTMNKWVMEEIVIDETNNSFLLNAPNARFRFLFRADGNNRPENYSAVYDGIYIDDFKIIKARLLSDPPVAVCQNLTVELNDSGNATITPEMVNNGSVDDIEIVSYSLDITTLDCSNIDTPVEVTLTVEDADGQTSTCTALITVVDVSAPVPDATELIEINVQCEVTSLTEPTAFDNCGGAVTVTNDAVLPITASTTITWTYEDESGNTATQTQNIVINDTTAPVPTLASLADVMAQCEVTSLVAPTASDNCGDTVTVTNDAVLPITASTTITWTYEDESGNTATQTQNIVINDNTAPVPTLASLADVMAQCEVTSLVAPAAADNCGGLVTVSSDAVLPITASTIITWTYEDESGNTATQTQNIVINDTTAPVPTLASLADVVAQCEVTSLVAPAAADNCGGLVTVSSDAVLPISASTIITWTYEDESGNTTTQTQNIVINDTTAPVPTLASLADVMAQCEVTSLVAPTASDNCGGLVTVSSDAVLPITASTIITWTYEDESGNTTTQSQNIVINDTTAPLCITQDISVELDEFGFASIIANDIDNGSNDNCGIASLSVFPNTFNNNDIGNVTVTFTVIDTSGNESNCNAIVNVIANTLNIDTVKDVEFTVRPNPFNNNICITVPKQLNGQVFKLKLYDLNGRIIFDLSKTPINGTIDLSDFEALDMATYLLQITNIDESVNLFKRLIKF